MRQKNFWNINEPVSVGLLTEVNDKSNIEINLNV